MSSTDELLAAVDSEARQELWSLAAQGKLPNPGRVRRQQEEWAARQRQRREDGLPLDSSCPDIVNELCPLTTYEQRELRRLTAALEAATDAATFVALVKGEPVPSSRLNPRIIKAHKRRT